MSFRERGRGGETDNSDQLPPVGAPTRYLPATQEWAPARDGPRILLVHGTTLQPAEPPGQGQMRAFWGRDPAWVQI